MVGGNGWDVHFCLALEVTARLQRSASAYATARVHVSLGIELCTPSTVCLMCSHDSMFYIILTEYILNVTVSGEIFELKGELNSEKKEKKKEAVKKVIASMTVGKDVRLVGTVNEQWEELAWHDSE